MYSRSTMDTKFYYFLKSIIKLHRRVFKNTCLFFPHIFMVVVTFSGISLTQRTHDANSMQ